MLILFRFIAPVEIGDIVTFTSEVVFTTDTAIQVSVAADVINAQTQKTTTTNVFQYTFTKADGFNIGKKVVPHSYEEAMRFVEGRRKVTRSKVDEMQW
jgi:acyl-coenzyme A thioesterase 9